MHPVARVFAYLALAIVVTMGAALVAMAVLPGDPAEDGQAVGTALAVALPVALIVALIVRLLGRRS